MTGKQCAKINSETRDGKGESGKDRGKLTRNPNVKKKRTVLKLLLHEKERRKAKAQSTIPVL